MELERQLVTRHLITSETRIVEVIDCIERDWRAIRLGAVKRDQWVY